MSKWQGFYSLEQISRLVGVPMGTLYLWRKRKILSPSVRIINADGKTEEGYSYADLAMIKLLRALRPKHLNLKSIVISLRHLFDRFGYPSSSSWSNAHVFVIDKQVYAKKPDNWDTTIATKYGQKGEMRVLGELFEEEGAYIIPKAFKDFIEIDLNIMGGEPVIKDTRVPTSVLAELFNEGMPVDLLANLYVINVASIEKAIDFEKSLDKATAKVRASVN